MNISFFVTYVVLIFFISISSYVEFKSLYIAFSLTMLSAFALFHLFNTIKQYIKEINFEPIKCVSYIISAGLSLLFAYFIIKNFNIVNKAYIFFLEIILTLLLINLFNYCFIKYKLLNFFINQKRYILDSASLIDERIKEIIPFFDGQFYIPSFILDEVKYLADAPPNSLKKIRGRKGLEHVNYLMENYSNVYFYKHNFKHIPEVDNKIIELADILNATIFTQDHILAQACRSQKIPVLDLNKLQRASAIIVRAHHYITVFVEKAGEHKNQGLAHLDDGSLVIIENGTGYIGQTVTVYVNSMLTSNTGNRMIFTIVKK